MDFTSLCCICAKGNIELFPLSTIYAKVSLHVIVQVVCPIRICDDEIATRRICKDCKDYVLDAYDLRWKCLSAQSKFQLMSMQQPAMINPAFVTFRQPTSKSTANVDKPPLKEENSDMESSMDESVAAQEADMRQELNKILKLQVPDTSAPCDMSQAFAGQTPMHLERRMTSHQVTSVSVKRTMLEVEADSPNEPADKGHKSMKIVHSNTADAEEFSDVQFEVVKTKQGNPKVVIDGNSYSKAGVAGKDGSQKFCCVQCMKGQGSKSRITLDTTSTKILKFAGEHNHD